MFFQHANDDDDSLTLLILHLHTCTRIHETAKIQRKRNLDLISTCSSRFVGNVRALYLEAQPLVITIWVRLVALHVAKLSPVQQIEYLDRHWFLIFSSSAGDQPLLGNRLR